MHGGNMDLRPVKDYNYAIVKKDVYGLYCQKTHDLNLESVNISYSEEPDYFGGDFYLKDVTR